MAIICIREGYSGHQAGGEVDSKTTVRRFSLVTDTPADDARFTWPQADPTDATIIIPAPGTLYPIWEDIRSREPQVTKVSPCFFNVEVRYGKDVNSTGNRSEDPFAANPLSKPAEERWDTVTTTEPVSYDINGLPYLTTFYEPVEGIEREFADQVLYLNRNEAAFDENNAYDWYHTIYDGTFRNVVRGRVFMNRIQVEHVKDEIIDSDTFGDILYSKVSYEIYFRFRKTLLINAYELVKQGGVITYNAIADTPENQAKYAWYHRRIHTSKKQLDANGLVVPFADGQEYPVGIATKQFKPDGDADFFFQPQYGYATWTGVS